MATHFQGSPAEISSLNVFITLFRAADTIQSRFARHLRRDGLTGPQFGVLESLHHLGPLEQHVIAEKLLVSRGNITFIVDKLEQLGLIARAVITEDRRCNRVTLTPKGSEFIARIFPEYAAYIAEIMSGLTEDERLALTCLLKKLGKHNNQEIAS